MGGAGSRPGTVELRVTCAYAFVMRMRKAAWEEEEWPIWAPIGSSVVVVVSLVTAVLQRISDGQHWLYPTAAALIAFFPFIWDVSCYLIKRPIWALPLWMFPIPVFIGTELLVFRPPPSDFAPFLLVFTTAEVVSRSKSMKMPVLVGLGAMAVMHASEMYGPYKGSFVWIIGIGFGWFGGLLIKTLQHKQEELMQAHAGLAEKAVADERSRIAREVHDVIAHSLSVTMLHVTAARMALEKGDRQDEAKDWLREAEEQGRKSLAEIRRTVGLLGSDESATAAPMPTLADLPTLVSDFRNAGLDVTLNVEGEVGELPDAAALNLYRIVQESLTNAAKHSPGAKTDVWLNVTDDDVRLRVFNEGVNGAHQSSNTDGGRGIRGMTERSVLLNGNLVVGAENGGWLVFLAAPRPSA